MKRIDPISLVASVFTIMCYTTFTALAWTRFPLAYSPVRNWLSDLGNPVTNPEGAAFYNTGIAFTAIGVLAFFLGLYGIRLQHKIQTLMIVLTVGFGALGALAMLMSALYPINRLAGCASVLGQTFPKAPLADGSICRGNEHS